MKILIITTYFAPDTAMGGKRPYTFAKYLAQFGHDVTVVRSGEILATIDPALEFEKYGIKVISYLGEDSPAEKFRRGEITNKDIKRAQSRISFIPVKIRKKISNAYHQIFKGYEYSKECKAAENYLEKMKGTLDSLKDEHFDVVFSTYGRLENIYGGEYAKRVLGCPWINDLRDRVTHDRDPIAHRMQLKTEQDYFLKSDACVAVSGSHCDDLRERYPSLNVNLIYNGYECDFEDTVEPVAKENRLTLCYTGSMYTGALDLSLLFKAFAVLESKGTINLDNITFAYAGGEFEYLQAQAAKHGVDRILVNKGFLSRADVRQLQCSSDIYVVSARNIQHYLDEIPGKIYEGISAGRPILTVVNGTTTGGELKQLQDKYHYGYCYEQGGGHEAFEELCRYLAKAYKSSTKEALLAFDQPEELVEDFKYPNLTRKLESIMESLCNK